MLPWSDWKWIPWSIGLGHLLDYLRECRAGSLHLSIEFFELLVESYLTEIVVLQREVEAALGSHHAGVLSFISWAFEFSSVLKMYHFFFALTRASYSTCTRQALCAAPRRPNSLCRHKSGLHLSSLRLAARSTSKTSSFIWHSSKIAHSKSAKRWRPI